MRFVAVLPLAVVFLSTYARAQPSPPVVVEQPADAITNVSGVAAFRVVAAGSGPFEYQWTHEGSLMPGATSDVLAIDHPAAEDAGLYQVRVTNAAGSALSEPARLTVRPAPILVDETFQADPTLVGKVSILLPWDDGGVLVAFEDVPGGPANSMRAELVRLRKDGQVDPGFRREFALRDEREAPIYRARITQLIRQPDGRVLVFGHFVSYAGEPAFGLVRLNADGSIDRSFAVSPDAWRPAEPQTPVAGDYAPKGALQRDGKIVVINEGGALVRRLANGLADPGFSPPKTAWVTAVCVDAAGRVIAGTTEDELGKGAAVAVLRENGEIDRTMTTGALVIAVGRLDPQSDGRINATIRGVTTVGQGPIIVHPPFSRVIRLKPDLSVDATLSGSALTEVVAADGARLLLNDGRLVEGETETKLNFGLGAQGYAFATEDQLWAGARFNDGSRLVRLNIVRDTSEPPRIVAIRAEPAMVRVGESTTLRVAAVAEGPLVYTWLRSSSSIPTETTEPVFRVTPAATSETNGFRVQVRNSTGTVTSVPAALTVGEGVLQIFSQPRRIFLTPGRVGQISVNVFATPAVVRREWRRNGLPVVGQAAVAAGGQEVLDLGIVDPAQAGSYSVTLWGGAGAMATSDPIVVVVEENSRFANLSTRAWVGEGTAILGFVIAGDQGRRVILRGVGPTLAKMGVANALIQPQLELFDGTGRSIARGESWERSVAGDAAALFSDVGAFPLEPGSTDTALVQTLRPGRYTVQLSGTGNSRGIGLIELYEADDKSDRISNLSSRVFVGPTWLDAAVAGFVIRGTVPKRVLVRVAGPGLAVFSIQDALTNPRLDIRDESGRVWATNDDWEAQTDAASVTAAGTSVGAFPFSRGGRDAALVLTLAPGSYTAVASSADGGSGTALVEVYEVP